MSCGRHGAAGWWREEEMEAAAIWGGMAEEGWGLTSRVRGKNGRIKMTDREREEQTRGGAESRS
jgi:hypothetical protein